jgi:hypothetical protein
MRKLLLLFTLALATQAAICQAANPFARNIADIKGAVVKQEQGDFNDPQTKKPIGHFVIVYIIDTIQHQLLNVSITTKDNKGELIYLYYYNLNQLVKASSGMVQNGYTVIQNTYDYDESDFKIADRDLQAFSETEEKYALLKESKRYLRVLKH